jgi:hypothetical protein
MAGRSPIFRGAFPAGADEEFSRSGKRPVIFDILGPDLETSILPEGLRLVLHVGPSNLSVKYTKVIERIQTRGGFVEQHFGDGTTTLDFEAATGGFMRLYGGLSNVTSPDLAGGTRRETLAYDSYLDFLALFHNNGSVYDEQGQIAFQGAIKCTFDGGTYVGWFTSFSVTEEAGKPYQFTMSASFEVSREQHVFRSAISNDLSGNLDPDRNASDLPLAQIPDL